MHVLQSPNTERSFIQGHNGLKMFVQVNIPDQPKCPIFIMHRFGSSSTRPEPTWLAQTALENNFVSVCFDATYSDGLSEGRPELATVTSFKNDLEHVVNWAKTKPWFSAPYILGGGSLAGLTVLTYAHEHEEEIKGVIALAPVVSGKRKLETYQKNDPEAFNAWKKTGITNPSKNGAFGLMNLPSIPWSHMEDCLQYDALSCAPDMNVPLFLYVGLDDPLTPLCDQKALFDAWGSTQKQLFTLPNEKHRFPTDEDHISKVTEQLQQWIYRI